MKYGEGTATAKAFIPAVRDNKEEVHSCLAAMYEWKIDLLFSGIFSSTSRPMLHLCRYCMRETVDSHKVGQFECTVLDDLSFQIFTLRA